MKFRHGSASDVRRRRLPGKPGDRTNEADSRGWCACAYGNLPTMKKKGWSKASSSPQPRAGFKRFGSPLRVLYWGATPGKNAAARPRPKETWWRMPREQV